MRKKVVFFGLPSFPYGSAGAFRVYNVCKTLVKAGYFCEVYVDQVSHDFTDRHKHGIKVIELKKNNGSGNSFFRRRFFRYFKFFLLAGRAELNALSARLGSDPDCIYIYSSNTSLILRTLFWARKKKIKTIIDVVEWDDYKNFPGGFLSPFFWNKKISLRLLSHKFDGVVCISSYIEKYYTKLGCKAFLMPPLCDLRDTDHKEDKINYNNHSIRATSNDKINLIYAGVPGRKELLVELTSVLAEIDPDGKDFSLTIAGDKAFEYFKKNKISSYPFLKFLGQLTNSEVGAALSTSDLSVVLRKSSLTNDAGFPSKLPESLSYGVPVLASDYSDVKDYIKDGYNGFMVPLDREGLKSKIQDILKIDKDKLHEIKANAKLTAEKYFDFPVYSDDFDKFLSSLNPPKS